MLGKRYTLIKKEVVNIPIYAGKTNAFAIVLYGMNENYDARRAHDFLASAFACFPEMDYCIITMPPSKRVFPLLQHFMRAVPRSGRSFRRELYFAYKAAVLRYMNCN
ncbi:cilia- and flagella-associated protein 61-like [Schistocerca cancellata]|uniref:cilia- and flagella-associated protein 61-like n=1 Tax=Schistocerca cancellata TaxID=274614 RepID=UPI002119AA87|nr:cilia- and flagella-associated protein 61-like [Schistocerca cancellata]